MKMNIHCIMHVPFEGLGYIKAWIDKNEHNLSYSKMYENDKLPSTNSFDWLIIMGGPMGIYDDNDYPWLIIEREFIKQAINQNKTVIGICLGAQFIADALGAKVFQNENIEIGWFPIIKESNAPISKNLPKKFEVFHWHGDTFTIPNNAIHLFSSEACINQGFIYNDKVVGLQFHIEITPDSLSEMLNNVGNELTKSKYIQTKDSIIEQVATTTEVNKKLENILNYLV